MDTIALLVVRYIVSYFNKPLTVLPVGLLVDVTDLVW